MLNQAPSGVAGLAYVADIPQLAWVRKGINSRAARRVSRVIKDARACVAAKASRELTLVEVQSRSRAMVPAR
jgi:hypothetical protein